MDTCILYQKNIIIFNITITIAITTRNHKTYFTKKMLLPKSLLQKRSILAESIKGMDIIKWHYKHIFMKHDLHS